MAESAAVATGKRTAAADGLDEVYVGDFEGFIARRDALAKRLKGEGDDEGAAHVKSLKKPSRTAWAVNQFAANGKKLRTELLAAGSDLREASEGLVSGDADREAMIKARDRERAAVGAAADAIAALAGEAGPALNEAALERVRQTLHAVALDDDVREEFEAARLTADREASGLGGGFGLESGGNGSAGKARKGKAKKPDRSAERKRRRREQLKAAEDEVAKLDRELEEAQQELDEAQKAAKRAQGDLKRATARQEKAESAAEKARGKVAELRED